MHPLPRSRSILVITALLLAATALASLLSAADAPLKTIRIGFASVGIGGVLAVGYSPFGSAQMLRLVDEEFAGDGIRIEWNFYRGAGPAVNEAIASGLLDAAWQGDLPSVIGRANGLKTRIVAAAGLRGNTYLAVPVASPARTLQDLVGRKVALHKGTNLQLTVSRILQAHALAERDFKSINLDSLAGVPAIAAGELDGLWGGPELLEAERAGSVRFVYDTRGQSPLLTRQCHLLVTEAFEAGHPDLVQRLVDVLVRRAAWESDEANRIAVFTLWERMGLPAATWEAEYRGALMRERQSPLLDDFFLAHYRTAAKAAQEFRLTRSTFSVDGWIEPKYVERAIRAQHLEGRWQPLDALGVALGAGTKAP